MTLCNKYTYTTIQITIKKITTVQLMSTPSYSRSPLLRYPFQGYLQPGTSIPGPLLPTCKFRRSGKWHPSSTSGACGPTGA